MTRKICVAFAITLALVVVGASAHAEEKAKDPNAPVLYTGFGTTLNVGGGVVAFTDDAMRDFAEVGGTWEARAVIGTRVPLALEAAYTGGAQAIDALGLDNSAALVSTGLEAMARVNFLTDEWQPYIAGGAGWRHYDVTNADFNTSSVAGDDDIFEIPMAAGISYRMRGFAVDLRTMFRIALEQDLIADEGAEDRADLHTWGAEMGVGWEF